ncbi:hypothetical protein P153DRAFT_432654 [Dothidotthia symphoricarpi CBS 119687]|uniref:Uncharacterized protein n=1 Tax=Dothidotthia symphoricarpi CBS 119687 TaxID=1392245 RepID=A0A6A6A6T7_9PLEO|nr:uncharacterized protein P153DRAFT_432654 [Dothidotthia symphoricarpi CBS 119687]KAF2127530.1 hypothetical protein P153DRAFT_432654 [Dothidotthia symphoricarpi CBS 119687]
MCSARTLSLALLPSILHLRYVRKLKQGRKCDVRFLLAPSKRRRSAHVRKANSAYLSHFDPGMEAEGRKAQRMRDDELAMPPPPPPNKRIREEMEVVGEVDEEETRSWEQRRAVRAAARNAHIIDSTRDFTVPPEIFHPNSDPAFRFPKPARSWAGPATGQAMDQFNYFTNSLTPQGMDMMDCRDYSEGSAQEVHADPSTPSFDPSLFVAAPDHTVSNLPEETSILDQPGNQQRSELTQGVRPGQPQQNISIPAPRSGFFPTITTLPPPSNPRRESFVSFLRDFPSHNYILPTGAPLNFTMVEIIAILPSWFKNTSLATRFLNNNITASIHLAILQEHRDLGITTEHERARAREGIADAYRKTMRSVDPEWTKARHRIPKEWNNGVMNVNTFVPDVVHETWYQAPPPIAFKALCNGLKKLPQGADAGDLTRALEYALCNTKFDQFQQPHELLFPDDLQMILGYIGRTDVTMEHTDRCVVRRYADVVRKAVGDRKPALKQMKSPGMGMPAAPSVKNQRAESEFAVPQATLQIPPGELNVALLSGAAPPVPKVTIIPSTPTNTIVRTSTPPPGFAFSAEVLALITPPGYPANHFASPPEVHPSETAIDRTRREVAYMDSLIQEHASSNLSCLPTPSPSPESKFDRKQVHEQVQTFERYSQTHLLRDCHEGCSEEEQDDSDLACAARYARLPDQIGTDWRVQDMALIAGLLALQDGN